MKAFGHAGFEQSTHEIQFSRDMLRFKFPSEDINQTLNGNAWRLHFQPALVQWSLIRLLEKSSKTRTYEDEYGCLLN